MIRFLRPAWLVLAVAVAVAVPAEVKVTPIVTPDGKVLASFEVPEGFGAESRAFVKTGLELEFTYTVELKKPGFWSDRTLGLVVVVISAKFDNLTASYTVSRKVDKSVTSVEPIKDEDELRKWLTQIDRVPLDVKEPLEPNADYYVQVKWRVSSRKSFPLWPFGHDDGSGRKSFTFVR